MIYLVTTTSGSSFTAGITQVTSADVVDNRLRWYGSLEIAQVINSKGKKRDKPWLNKFENMFRAGTAR